MRASIFVLMAIFVANSVYAGTMMAFVQTSASEHADHDVSMHMSMGDMMHEMPMTDHDADKHNHSGYCHDCLACLSMLPANITTHVSVIPNAISISTPDVLYSSPPSQKFQRPPITTPSA